MSWSVLRNILLRLVILAVGFAAIYGLVYTVGKVFIPITDPWDKAILAAINPDTYAPGFDELFRAINDYTISVIVLPMLSWMLLSLIYWLLPKSKPILMGIFVTETLVLTGMAAMGKIEPNKVYTGVNILEVLMFFSTFGLAAYLFHVCNRDMIGRVAKLFVLVLVAGLLTDFGATKPIKDSISRPRPFNDANKPWNESVRNIPDELLRGANSYPSGHTSGAFSVLAPVFWFVRDKRVRAGLLTWAALQGIGRVYTAAHFPLCICMGGLLGFTIGTLVFFTLGGAYLRPGKTEPAPENTAPAT